MIRKAVIGLLTLGAVGTLAFWIGIGLREQGMWMRLQEPYAWGYSGQSVIVGTYHSDAFAWIHSIQMLVSRSLLGFGIVRRTRGGTTILAVFVPYWFIALLFSAYPTLAFIRGPVRRWRRRRKGLCVRCGYNLTGLPEPRCPECGWAIR